MKNISCKPKRNVFVHFFPNHPWSGSYRKKTNLICQFCKHGVWHVITVVRSFNPSNQLVISLLKLLSIRRTQSISLDSFAETNLALKRVTSVKCFAINAETSWKESFRPQKAPSNDSHAFWTTLEKCSSLPRPSLPLALISWMSSMDLELHFFLSFKWSIDRCIYLYNRWAF